MPGWRRNLAAIWVAQMLAIIGFNARTPFFIFFLQDDLGVHNTRALTLWSGVLSAIGALTMTIAAPIWGVISDRYGRKPIVVRAIAVACPRPARGGRGDARHRLSLRRICCQYRAEGASRVQPRVDADG